jgi:predicted RNA binding protein YcfA (HicA-like mRNA interferase family)
MKLPRDLSGTDLAKSLWSLGYEIVRQTGSHMRLATQQQGEYHLTIPNHSSLKIGTLAGALTDVAQHFGVTQDELLGQLFGS